MAKISDSRAPVKPDPAQVKRAPAPQPRTTAQPKPKPIDELSAGKGRRLRPTDRARGTLPSAAARAAHEAMFSFGAVARIPADGKALNAALAGKSPAELSAVRAAYQKDFKRDFDADLRGALATAQRLPPLPAFKAAAAELARAVGQSRGAARTQSPLGGAVMDAAWGSALDDGTVPVANVFTDHNALDGVYVDAKEIFPAMADAIAGAKHEVLLETFEWDPSATSKDDPSWKNDPTMVIVDGIKRLEQRLAGEQARGLKPEVPVKIYVALDGTAQKALVGGTTAAEKCRRLQEQLDAIGIDPKLVEIHLGAHERKSWGAVHSKLLVVDGYKSIITGANPQKFQTMDRSWHDTGYGVRGGAGIAMARNFDDTWKETTELSGPGLTTSTRSSPIDHHPSALHPDLGADPLLKDAALGVFAATRRPYDPLKTGAPGNADSPQDAAFLAVLANAKDTVKIESPNLNNTRMMEAIAAAVGRGVKVELVLSLGFNSEAERQKVAGISAGGSNEDIVPKLYASIADPAARALLQVKWHSTDGLKPVFGQQTGASHTKYLSADDQLLMIGSANQDNVSWYLARETNLLLDSAEATRQADGRVFDPDFARGIDVFSWAKGIVDGSVPVTPELNALLDGDARGWAQRLSALQK